MRERVLTSHHISTLESCLDMLGRGHLHRRFHTIPSFFFRFSFSERENAAEASAVLRAFGLPASGRISGSAIPA